MDMNDIGYFLYMEECETIAQQEEIEEAEELGKGKVNNKIDMVGELGTQYEN